MRCDFVVCLDVSDRMRDCLEDVKKMILRIPEQYEERRENSGYTSEGTRMRVIAFRNIGADPEPIRESRFFSLPEEKEGLVQFLDALEPSGGEASVSALEAVALALKSDWTQEGFAIRHTVLVFSNSPVQHLGTCAGHPAYPKGLPRNLAQLGAWWEGQDGSFVGSYRSRGGVMCIFAPNAEPWTTMETWNRYWPVYSRAGADADEFYTESLFDMLVGSI